MSLADDHLTDSFEAERKSGERFGFGDNWRNFLSLLDEDRITRAEDSLRHMLGVKDLTGRSFLDIGSGSGLFSLAARRLGARVMSFDYDPGSVWCTRALRRRYCHGDADWQIERGSALDAEYLGSLGQFDVVYSWGVLHHTGDMWRALEQAERCVAPGGQLFVAIYNDQGGASKRWLGVKRIYNRLPRWLRPLWAALVYLPIELRLFAVFLIRGKPLDYFRRIANFHSPRGMSWWHDKLDWIGGYPFEVATPEALFEFSAAKGYRLTKLATRAGRHGCNELVFSKPAGN